MQRACAAALLHKGESILFNPGHSSDDKAAIDIIKSLGATVDVENGKLKINSSTHSRLTPHISRPAINCGESGLSIRMFTPIAALSEQEVQITGSGSLVERPLDFFDEILPQLDVKIKSNKGKLPLIVQGPLQPKNIEVDGSLSSQFLTGLLFAYSGAGASNISIRVKNLQSKPYIDLTLDVMKKFSLNVPENKNYEEFIFHDNFPIPQSTNSPINYTVESDWSNAAFLLVAGAIAGPITVRGLDLTSTQGDKKILDALMSANAGIAIEAKGIKIHPSPMSRFEFDATDCPDLFPPLVSLAAYAKGLSKIKGVSRLVHKESNRAMSLKNEFAKMGIQIELSDDTMLVHGGEVKGAVVHSNHDHRIAMACAVAALGASGETVIEEAGAVKKSYPDFFEDLKKLNADVSLPNNPINYLTE